MYKPSYMVMPRERACSDIYENGRRRAAVVSDLFSRALPVFDAVYDIQQFLAIMDAYLRVNAFDMSLHRTERDTLDLGDIRSTATLRNQGKNLSFTP